MARDNAALRRNAGVITFICSFWTTLLRFSGFFWYWPPKTPGSVNRQQCVVVLMACCIVVQIAASSFAAVEGLYSTIKIERVSDLLLNFHTYLFPLIYVIYICLMWRSNKKLVQVFEFFKSVLPDYCSLLDLITLLTISGLLLLIHPVQNLTLNFYDAIRDSDIRQTKVLQNHPNWRFLATFVGPMVFVADIVSRSAIAGKQIVQCFIAIVPFVFGTILYRVTQNFERDVSKVVCKPNMQKTLKDHEETCDMMCLYDGCSSWLNVISYLERLTRFLFLINQCCKSYASDEQIPNNVILAITPVLFTVTVQTLTLVYVTEKEAGLRDSMERALANDFLENNDAAEVEKHLRRVTAKRAGITFGKLVVNREFAVAVVGGVVSYTLLFAELNDQPKQMDSGLALTELSNKMDLLMQHLNSSSMVEFM